MRTRPVRFTIHANDAGTEAYRDGYVQELKHALAQAEEAIKIQPGVTPCRQKMLHT